MGVDVNNEFQKNKNAPLHNACTIGLEKEVETLITAGANLEAMGKNDMAPIHFATIFCALQAFKKSDPKNSVADFLQIN